MKRFLALLTLLILFLCGAQAENPILTGRTTKDMTIRSEKSKSAKKVGSVAKGETVSILSQDDEWAEITKDGTDGYILFQNVTDLASAEAYDDRAAAVYIGTARSKLSVRSAPKKSAHVIQTVAQDEEVCILELGDSWHKIIRNGVTGYISSDGIKALEAVQEGAEIPEQYIPRPEFQANYTAQADVKLSIRAKKDADSRLLGTVYENEDVEVMETDGEWAYIRSGDSIGYVRADHLRYYTRLDAYGPLVPGTKCYPYAAHVLSDTEIYDSKTGELLRTVPAGAVIAVSAFDSDMSVTLPYDRITGKISATGNLEFEPVHSWDEAASGDLISVFCTFYDPEQSTQAQIGRLHNIMQGVGHLDNIVIPAGERFSFNRCCAPYNKKNGYQLGPIINYTSSNHLGYGGGICQVSTTLYNAVLQIPIYVAKWQVHSSYGISYVPLQFDAAVGAGNIDLRLDNTLPYSVRLSLQAEGGVLTVRIYRYE